jgi:F420-dependent oxidoreductase-like protein
MAAFGILFSDFGPDRSGADLFPRVADAARAAERADLASITVMDHFHQHPPFCQPTDPMPEAYVLLGGLAAITTTMKLGTLVTAVTYRNPALLAKMATTLDVVSGGRAFLGIGASWHDEEYRAYGYGDALPSMTERLDRLEEAVQIFRRMFSDERSSFVGRHYCTRDAINIPRPVRAGGVPILIGGVGERRTLKLVAGHADMSNMLGRRDELAHKLGVLRQHCEGVGRDPDEIYKMHTCMVITARSSAEAERRAAAAHPGQSPGEYRGRCMAGDPASVAAQAAELFDLGFDELVVFTDRLWTKEDVSLLGEVASLFER